jgi:hypothetical protein
VTRSRGSRGVERHADATCLEHPEDRDDRRQLVSRDHTNRLAQLFALEETMRDLVRGAVELVVGDDFATAFDRDTIPGVANHRSELLGQGTRRA